MDRTVDDECLELAESFLSEYPSHNTETEQMKLALRIQDAVEDFLNEEGLS